MQKVCSMQIFKTFCQTLQFKQSCFTYVRSHSTLHDDVKHLKGFSQVCRQERTLYLKSIFPSPTTGSRQGCCCKQEIGISWTNLLPINQDTWAKAIQTHVKSGVTKSVSMHGTIMQTRFLLAYKRINMYAEVKTEWGLLCTSPSGNSTLSSCIMTPSAVLARHIKSLG